MPQHPSKSDFLSLKDEHTHNCKQVYEFLLWEGGRRQQEVNAAFPMKLNCSFRPQWLFPSTGKIGSGAFTNQGECHIKLDLSWMLLGNSPALRAAAWQAGPQTLHGHSWLHPSAEQLPNQFLKVLPQAATLTVSKEPEVSCGEGKGGQARCEQHLISWLMGAAVLRFYSSWRKFKQELSIN